MNEHKNSPEGGDVTFSGQPLANELAATLKDAGTPNPPASREPFKQTPESAGFADDVNGAIRQVPGKPELLIRSQHLDIIKDPYKTVAMLGELPDKYKIHVPTIRPFIAQDQEPVHELEGDRKQLYMVYDRIDGQNLYAALTEGQVPEAEVAQLWQGLIQYYQDASESGEPFLDDLTSKFSQFKYGTNAAKPEEPAKVYLVDVGAKPVFDTKDYIENPDYGDDINDFYRQRAHGRYTSELLSALSDLSAMMSATEQITGASYDDERNRIIGILKGMQASEPDYVDQIKAAIDDVDSKRVMDVSERV